MRLRTVDRNLFEQRGLEVVPDLVDGVEAQAVEAVFLEPIKRVLDEEGAHGRAIVGDGHAPGRVALRIEEVGRVGVQVVAVRAEVIVDHVEKDHQPARVRRVDEALERLGPP